MKNNILIIGAILLIGIVVSCQKEIKLKQLPYDSKLSIECLITPNQLPKVYLNKTVPYLTGKAFNNSFFARNATVTITSSAGTITFVPDSIFTLLQCDYIYYYKGNTTIAANSSYTLTIFFEGKNYTATCNTSQPIVAIDSIGYVKVFKDLYGEHEGVVIHYTDPSTSGQYYRYDMKRMIDSSNYKANLTTNGKSPCLTEKKVEAHEIGRTIFSDAISNGQNSTITLEPAYKHKLGDTTYIRLQTMDKNTFDYYDQLDRQKLAQFNPFVEPSYLKPTQFKDAFGCFGAYSISDSVLFVYPE
ncbi:MAG: hypothetical protein RJA07_1841 [Bacteroidota bacterium]|jgi:hypothetical protein